jgi:hypothetical protein
VLDDHRLNGREDEQEDDPDERARFNLDEEDDDDDDELYCGGGLRVRSDVRSEFSVSEHLPGAVHTM